MQPRCEQMAALLARQSTDIRPNEFEYDRTSSRVGYVAGAGGGGACPSEWPSSLPTAALRH